MVHERVVCVSIVGEKISGWTMFCHTRQAVAPSGTVRYVDGDIVSEPSAAGVSSGPRTGRKSSTGATACQTP